MSYESATTETHILAFTSQQVERLTGLSQRQLRAWEESGVFVASYVDDAPYRPYRRIYSFRDLVSLMALALLREQFDPSMDELRQAAEYLARHDASPWDALSIGVTEQQGLAFRDPETGHWMPSGLAVSASISLDEVRQQAERKSDALRGRKPEDIGRITRHRHIAHNTWVIAGTRIPTSAIWHFHEAGHAPDEIQRQYPQLTLKDIEAAIAHEAAIRQAA